MSLSESDHRKIDELLSRYEGEIDLGISVPAEEFKQRWTRVQTQLKRRDLDVGFFFWYREMPGDGIYLTGYNPTIERASGLIGQEGSPLVVSGPEAGMVAKDIASKTRVDVAYAEEFAIPDEYYEDVSYRSLKEMIPTVAGRPVKRIGLLTGRNFIPQTLIETLQSAAGENVELVDAAGILEDLRYEKSPAEFACMEQADKIACAAVRAILAILKPGLREAQVAAVADYVMKSLGAENYGVETIVTSGSRGWTVIGPASNKVIRDGEIVQFGCSPSYEGYKGISRRAVVVGKPTPTQRKYFEILDEAFARAANALKEVVEKDLETKHVDLAARDYFAQHEIDGRNMKQFHTYGSAHGTGLTECLEPLVVGPDTTARFGHRVGIMLDVGCYGHPNEEIAGGCVEDAFGKEGNTLLKWSDLPINVADLVGTI